MLEQISLSSERLILRPFTLEDARKVRELAGHPDIAATTLTVPHPYSLDMAEKWISQHADLWAQGKDFIFAIVLLEENILIGCISLTVNHQHGRGELGYWIGTDYWGQGYATEAAQAIIQFGLFGLGLNRIFASHLLFNPASGKVMEKAGLRREGILRQHIFKGGKFHDSVIYGILRGEC